MKVIKIILLVGSIVIAGLIGGYFIITLDTWASDDILNSSVKETEDFVNLEAVSSEEEVMDTSVAEESIEKVEIDTEKTSEENAEDALTEILVELNVEDTTEESTVGIVENEISTDEKELEWEGIEPMDSVMYAQNDVNVRLGPGTEFEKIGRLSRNEEVVILGRDKESGWYYIEYEEARGYVSDNYLGDYEVIIQMKVVNTQDTVHDNSAGVAVVQNATESNGNTTHSPFNGDMWTADDLLNALEWHKMMTGN